MMSIGNLNSFSALRAISSLMSLSRWKLLKGVFCGSSYVIHIIFHFRDTDFILSQRNLDGVVSLTKKHSSVGEKKKKETNLVKTLFSQLSTKMVQALYEKYRIDFQMFEYGISDYVKYASESEGLMPDVIISALQSESVENEASDEVTSVESINKEP